MTYSTTNVYRMKLEIITFSKNFSSCLPRTEQKFYNDPRELDHGIEKMREHGIMRLTKGRSANHVIRVVGDGSLIDGNG